MAGAFVTQSAKTGANITIDMRLWSINGGSGISDGPYIGTAILMDNGGTRALARPDDSAFAPGSGDQTFDVLPVGLIADETATDSVDEGDIGAPRMTLDRKVVTAPQPHAAGGLSIFRSIDLDEGSLEVVKASAGAVYGMWVSNLSESTIFIKFYDATSGTLGTGTPVITIAIPGNSTDDVSGNFGPGGMGVQFSTGICVGASRGVLDNDTTAVSGDNAVLVNIFYK